MCQPFRIRAMFLKILKLFFQHLNIASLCKFEVDHGNPKDRTVNQSPGSRIGRLPMSCFRRPSNHVAGLGAMGCAMGMT